MSVTNQVKQYVSIENTENLGFSIIACQDILAGEEIYVDYGETYFEDQADGCPCLTCKPDKAEDADRQDRGSESGSTRPATNRHLANRLKRKRQAENKRNAQQMGS